MRTVTVYINENESVIRSEITAVYEEHAVIPVEIKTILDLGGKIHCTHGDYWVCHIPNNGIVQLDLAVPSWDPTHAVCLTHCDWQYVEVYAASIYQDGVNYNGLLYTFEDDVSLSPDTAFVRYIL